MFAWIASLFGIPRSLGRSRPCLAVLANPAGYYHAEQLDGLETANTVRDSDTNLAGIELVTQWLREASFFTVEGPLKDLTLAPESSELKSDNLLLVLISPPDFDSKDGGVHKTFMSCVDKFLHNSEPFASDLILCKSASRSNTDRRKVGR